MKILRISVSLAALLLAGLAQSSFAATIRISSAGAGYRTGPGGEFKVTDVSGSIVAGVLPFYDSKAIVGGGIEVFCIEYNEFISLPGTYTATVSAGAIYGGVAGGIDHDSNPLTPTTDLVSVGTAYLYSLFARGVLGGYDYTPGAGRAASATALQNAIWWLEDEITLSASAIAANPFLTAAFAAYGTPGAGVGDVAGGAKTNNTLYSVGVLNLGGATPDKQDQLIYGVPDGGLTIALLGLGLSGVALFRRRIT